MEPAPFFAGIDEAALRALGPDVTVRVLNAGEKLWSPGASCDGVHVVLEGRLDLLFDRGWGAPRVFEEIGPGGTVGEAEALSGDRCLAEVRAQTPCRLAVLPHTVFERVLQSRPELLEHFSQLVRRRACRLLVARNLTGLFGIGGMSFADPAIRAEAEREWLEFEEEVLGGLERSADWVNLGRGEYLFRQGDTADGAWVLVSGLLRVSVDDGHGVERTIARIRQGEILGEMALITDENRSASISALRDCELFRLPAAVFRHVTEKYPRNVLNVYRTVTQRFRDSLAGAAYRERTGNIALLAAGAGLDLAAFTRELAGQLSQHDSVDILDATGVDRMLGRAGVAQSAAGVSADLRLVQWLNGLESRFGHLLYLGDPGWSAWNERCLRQADRVVAVADAGAQPWDELAVIAQKVASVGLAWDLVLLHPAGIENPRDTAAWLERSSAAAVYHVRQGNERDMARLARILSGRAIGLVLGGGGARGFAHLGVLRAMDELGIPIDIVGGTSIGAPICGWLATGMSAEECMAAAREAFSSLIDFTFPTTALLAGKRITRTIQAEAANRDIEDFWLPFFCVSTNLTHSRVEVHRRGSSARAIRASVSIPGVLPPVPSEGQLLVDGGVLNNLPIDVMRDLNPSGTVIAIDVVLPKSFFAAEDYGLDVSGWRQLFSRLVPGMKGAQTPAFASVIMQSMMVGSGHSRERLLEQDEADFYRNIHVHGVGMLQFEALEEAAEVGYRESIGPLREWLASRPDLLPAAAQGTRSSTQTNTAMKDDTPASKANMKAV